jgi:hypothetical protein
LNFVYVQYLFSFIAVKLSRKNGIDLALLPVNFQPLMSTPTNHSSYDSGASNGREIFELYNRMESDKILLSFKGDVTSDLTASVLSIMEKRLMELNETPKLRKKIYNVMVECLQNLYHHIDSAPDSDDEDAKKKSAIFMIGLNNQGYSITTGNYIDSTRVPGFADRLNRINALNPEELKELYKEVLNSSERSGKGGGGLGMIDIARKTGKKLNYDFIPVTDYLSFFSLSIIIDTEDNN